MKYPDEIQSLLCDEQLLIRQGEVLALPFHESRSNGDIVNGKHDQDHKEKDLFRIVTTEPVLQGYAKEGLTEFVVVPPYQDSKSAVSSESALSERPSQSQQVTYDISEDFLAASLMEGLDELPASEAETLPFGLGRSPSASWPSVASKLKDSSKPSVVRKGRTVMAVGLDFCPDDEELLPEPDLREDQALRVFVDGSDLSKLGFFSGDLVSILYACGTMQEIKRLIECVLQVELHNQSNGDRRLVHIYAHDSTPFNTSMTIMNVSPLLLVNMGNPTNIQISPAQVSLQANDFVFPVARSISIARVASEHSMHKKYQSLFLTALKAYFQSRNRILKEGDLIAVPIEEGLARFLGDDSDKEEVQEADEDYYECISNTPF